MPVFSKSFLIREELSDWMNAGTKILNQSTLGILAAKWLWFHAYSSFLKFPKGVSSKGWIMWVQWGGKQHTSTPFTFMYCLKCSLNRWLLWESRMRRTFWPLPRNSGIYVWIQVLLIWYLYFQGLLTFSSRQYSLPQALIGCSSTPVSLQAWVIQLLVGSCTVQTQYALCAKFLQTSSSHL